MPHNLKTDPEVFQASFDNLKDFEIRFNDRDFKIGDELVLMETKYSGEEMRNGKPLAFTKRKLHRTVKYILKGGVYGLAEGWVILALQK